MSDLVERLRSRAKYAHTTCWCESELTEAADEIERLRSDLDEYSLAVMTEKVNVLKLQAVVDIHKKIMKYPTIRDFIGSILANKSDEAIAALEGGNNLTKATEMLENKTNDTGISK